MTIHHETGLPLIRTFDKEDLGITKIQRRNLPHWELSGSTYFVTICVDKEELGQPFLDKKLAKFMMDFICQYDNKTYLLYSFVVMTDHIHMIIKPLHVSLSKIFHCLKGGSSFHINKMLGRRGKFWQDETFDHLIRSNEWLVKYWEYVKNNPVKKGLVEHAEDYPFSSFYKPKT